MPDDLRLSVARFFLQTRIDERADGHRPFAHGLISTKLGCPRHVRFPPDSDRTADIAGGPFGATTGSGLLFQSGHLSGGL
jgi:hypothetical protein